MIKSFSEVAGRRWYVLAIGVLVTLGVVAYLWNAPGVYWARTGVVLLGPATEVRPNKLDSNSAGLIATAGLIERELNAGPAGIPAIGNDVTLVDQGIYDGAQVRQPNYGGQWSNNFTEPVLEVQASGPNAAIVEQRMASMTAQISTLLEQRQDEAGVASSSRISVALAPAVTRINYGHGNRTRAAGTALLLGVAGTAALVGGLERRRRGKVDAFRRRPVDLLEHEATRPASIVRP